MKKLLALSGSTRRNSSNLKLIMNLVDMTAGKYEVTILPDLSILPYFNIDLDNEKPPKSVTDFRKQISEADGVIICTPEYIFSLPGSLKNAFEWCVSTMVFSQKPVGLITASTSGERAHEELKLIMSTLEAKFEEESTLLIKGIKGKFDENGNIKDKVTLERMEQFLQSFDALLDK
ncbi:NADPH-dependent FMN reductase [Alicyclobacillus sp. SO9]|uniref:NADPH-dependent FMN reductase n=1 Tax=Alicyclobacillus sp. SO9 TaxID=2665646 RepID=UPI0018E7BB92|nr:NADPH-dependent FMN reductase [Alicyclobacillus sp. SO9]QQE78326.1 NAD(P)H-dependent oxidoreductase [Alicyclobacillus sp. SO9]